MNSLGDRIKAYENVTRNYLIRRMPVMIRCDGRSFHNLLKGANKPFDKNVMNAMIDSALMVAEDMHEMLFSIGKNWTNDLSDIEKMGLG